MIEHDLLELKVECFLSDEQPLNAYDNSGFHDQEMQERRGLSQAEWNRRGYDVYNGSAPNPR
jgi:hypothetical protein